VGKERARPRSGKHPPSSTYQSKTNTYIYNNIYTYIFIYTLVSYTYLLFIFCRIIHIESYRYIYTYIYIKINTFSIHQQRNPSTKAQQFLQVIDATVFQHEARTSSAHQKPVPNHMLCIAHLRYAKFHKFLVGY
jgi:hypothetical protein